MNVYVSLGHNVKYISTGCGKFISMTCGQKSASKFESNLAQYQNILYYNQL